MTYRLPNFNADRDRGDPERAAQLLDRLWLTREIKIACAQRLARSLCYAHQLENASWAMTMFDSYIRLNVGQVLVLQFKSDKVLFYARSERGEPVLPSVPVPSREVEYLSAEIASISPRQWKDHERFISAAVEAKKSSPFGRAFSEGVMLHLEKLLETRLPRPSYRDSAAEENGSAPRLKPELEPFDLPTAFEGRRQLVTHYDIERDRSIIEDKKNAVREETGGLACEVCNFDFRIYKELGEGFCEVHHLRPLSEVTSTVETSLDDLAIVCANCHRMIHRDGQARSLASVRALLQS